MLLYESDIKMTFGAIFFKKYINQKGCLYPNTEKWVEVKSHNSMSRGIWEI